MNINHSLKLEGVSSYNVRFVRYFISIDTEREYVDEKTRLDLRRK